MDMTIPASLPPPAARPCCIPGLIDDENPEWTAADFKRARPAKAVLPELIGKAAAQLLKPRGRPKSPDAKVSISLRIPPDILARWKASGPG